MKVARGAAGNLGSKIFGKIKRFQAFLLLFAGLACLNAVSYGAKSDSVHVQRYTITLDLSNLADHSLHAEARLEVASRVNRLDRVRLDLLRLIIDSVMAGNEPVTGYSYNDTVLSIPLKTLLDSGNTAEIRVVYHGTPQVESAGWGGFHFEGNSLAYNMGVALADRPHSYGRAWFPCIDEFTDRSAYDLFVKTAADKRAVCDGLLVAVTMNPDKTRTYHWQLQQPVPAYLASVAVSDYVAVTGVYPGQQGDIPTAIYVHPADTLKAGILFTNLNRILAYFESCFGPYRFPRVGYVVTTLGAMEHATNIAYPAGSLTAGPGNEWLYAHELSHMWFGDLVTCRTEQDMWLNEAWAVFCESLFREGLYGKESYRENMRAKLKDVLQFTHLRDGGYLALAGMPSAYTYGSTVYEKGGVVIHTLRNYLGDSLFFPAIRMYLDSFAFRNVSSLEFRDFLSAKTGTDMNDFFDAWVFRPGFPHFSIDSFTFRPERNTWRTTVYLRQRTKGTALAANSNRVEVTFMNDKWQKYTTLLAFSGRSAHLTVSLPFAPTVAILDPDEKIAQAVTANMTVVRNTGRMDFPETFFSLETKQLNDSALVRAEHHWMAPDSLQAPAPGIKLSGDRYWKIDGIFPKTFRAKGRFSFSRSRELDNFLAGNIAGTLMMLYRKSVSESWTPVPFIIEGSQIRGTIVVDNLRKGEYSLAVRERIL